MSPLQQKFADRWPDWFAKVRCGFYLPNGWEQLVWTLCETLSEGRTPYEMQVEQVKEKFGGLRFYYTAQDRNEIDLAVNLAERLSQKTCQQCGDQATTETHHTWMVTLCTPCRSQCRP